MSLKQPLKFHYYFFRKLYFVFILLILVITNIVFLSNDDLSFTNQYLTIIIITTYLFSTLAAIFEFTFLINQYLSLKTVKREIFISSIIFALINALFQAIILFGVKSLWDVYYPNASIGFGLTLPLTYITTFILHLTVFSVIGSLASILKGVKKIKYYLYFGLFILGIFVSFKYNKEIITFIKDIPNLYGILYQYIHYYILTLIPTWIVLFLRN